MQEFQTSPQGKNVPYKKSFDSNGKLLNPIGDGYFSMWPNRRMRRSKPNDARILTRVQLIPTDNGIKKVLHYKS